MILRVPRLAALVVIAALVAAASLVSFAESYRGLYLWASRHGLGGAWAAAWPVQVDVFIAVGELALFVAPVDRWAQWSRAGAWAVTVAGLAVSVAGNVGHAPAHDLATRVTFAIPPLAAAFALAVGLGVLKRVVEAQAVPAPVPVVVPKPPPLPKVREVRERQNCGPETEKKIRSELERYKRGLGGMVPAPARVVKEAPAGMLPPVPAGANGSRPHAG